MTDTNTADKTAADILQQSTATRAPGNYVAPTADNPSGSVEYIPGLAPSVPLAVDDPTSPSYQNPGASDMMHMHIVHAIEAQDAEPVKLDSEAQAVKDAQDNLNKALAAKAEADHKANLKVKEENDKIYADEEAARLKVNIVQTPNGPMVDNALSHYTPEENKATPTNPVGEKATVQK